MTGLERLVQEARAIAGFPDLHPCVVLGHQWVFTGARRCPRLADGTAPETCEGSESVYECERCGDCDYGERGGPGWKDCVAYCRLKETA